MPARAPRSMLVPLAMLALACAEPTALPQPDDPPSLSALALPPGGIPVNACGTLITTPGDYWVTRDLTGCRITPGSVTPDIITIQADNVTLHVNGHRLVAGLKNGQEHCIVSRASNATIVGPGDLGYCVHAVVLEGSHNLVRGLHLKAFDLGVYLREGTGNVVEDMTFGGGGYAAVYTGTGTSANVIRRNTVRGELEYGIMPGPGDLIEANTISRSGVGIYTGANVSGSVIRNNVISAQVAIDAGSGHIITGNRIRHSGNGILVWGTGNLISGNLLRENYLDMLDQNLDGCTVNTWTGNQFQTADPPCIQ